jgi:hypothetical protein
LGAGDDSRGLLTVGGEAIGGFVWNANGSGDSVKALAARSWAEILVSPY